LEVDFDEIENLKPSKDKLLADDEFSDHHQSLWRSCVEILNGIRSDRASLLLTSDIAMGARAFGQLLVLCRVAASNSLADIQLLENVQRSRLRGSCFSQTNEPSILFEAPSKILEVRALKVLSQILDERLSKLKRIERTMRNPSTRVGIFEILKGGVWSTPMSFSLLN
jgi:hypothetical protein